MTTIALLRHYPTDWNGEARLQGRTDRPLTEAAREKLRALALPPPWDIARLVASPLSRARETAEILAAGREVATDSRLVEQSWGVWEGRLSHELLMEPESNFVPTHEIDWDFRPPKGESQADVWARTKAALADLAQAGHPAVVVTHKAAMRVILSQAAQIPPGETEIKRGRLYPIALAPDGTPSAPAPAVRLVPRG